MATAANRLALKGELDLPRSEFVDLTMGLVDADGCARVELLIQGPFQNPEIAKPSILRSLLGPALALLRQGRNLLAGDECEIFYAGSLPAPQ